MSKLLNYAFYSLFLISQSVFANTIPSSATYTVTYNCTPPATGVGASAAAACAAFLAPLQVCDYNSQGYTRSLAVSSSTETSCVIAFPGGYLQTFGVAKSSVRTCPPGYTLDPSGETCTGEPPPDCNAKKGQSFTATTTNLANPTNVCEGGCSGTVIEATDQAMKNGQQVVAGSWAYDGKACSGNNATKQSPDSQADLHKCQGSLNGVAQSFSCQDVSKQANEFKKISDKETKKETHEKNGETTTIIIRKDPDTDDPPTEDPPVTDKKNDQEEFCRKYPNAIACATFGSATKDDVGTKENEITSISPISVGGAGSCPAPRTTTLHNGFVFTWNWTYFCNFAILIRPFILALAWLSAGLIFIGGVRQ